MGLFCFAAFVMPFVTGFEMSFGSITAFLVFSALF